MRISVQFQAFTFSALVLWASAADAQGLGDLFRGMSGGNQEGNSWGQNRGGQNYSRRQYNSDASDGPSEGGGGWNRRPSSPEVDWGGIVGGIIDAADRAGRDARARERYDDDYNDNRRYYPQQPQQPRYYYPQPRTVQPAVSVKTNAPPKVVEKILPVEENAEPEFVGFGLDDTTRELMTEVAKDKAKDNLAKVKEELGPIAMEKDVKAELDAIEEKIKNGEAVTSEDIEKLRAAVIATGATVDSEKLNEQADQIIKYSDIAERLNEESDPGNPDDDGLVDVFGFDALPEDDMVTLPDGSVAIGTGGQGGITMTSMAATDVYGMSVGAGEPVPDYAADLAKRAKDGILLMNPAELGQNVEYVIANQNYSMQPGYTQHLAAGRTWVIEFDRGESFGKAKYTLTDGTYAFGSLDKGWELYKQSLGVTIDNSGNPDAFHYNIDNTQCELAAGESQAHTSAYPIYVRFDRGNGKEVTKRVTTKGAHYQISVDPTDGLWEMFAADPAALLASADAEGGDEGTGGAKRGGTPAKSSKARTARLRALMLQTSKKE